MGEGWRVRVTEEGKDEGERWSCSWRAFLAGSTSVSESPSWMMPRRSLCRAKKAEAEE